MEPGDNPLVTTNAPKRWAIFYNFMKWPLWGLGIALFVGLVSQQGASDLLAALANIGWAIVLVCAYHVVPLILNSIAWSVLIKSESRAGLLRLFLYRWICQSANNLLPVAQIGGELIRARLLARNLSVTTANASVIVDFTLGIITQAIFTLVGVLLLVNQVGMGEYTQNLLYGALFAVLPLLLFYAVQRFGMIGLGARLMSSLLPGEKWGSLVGGLHTLNHAVIWLYQQRFLILSGTGLRLLAWFSCAVET